MADTASELALLIAARDSASPTLRNIQRELRQIRGDLDDSGKAAQSTGRHFDGFASNAAKLGVAVGAAGIAAAGAATAIGITAVKAASDLNESMNKVDVIFGETSEEIKAFAASAAQSMGQSKAEAMSAAGTFGNLFKTIGMGTQDVTAMSMEVVKLGSDLASFHNIRPEEALEKLRAGLIGEAEPLRSLGVLLTEATVKSKAMEMGIAGANDELTEAQKVQARYALILEQTKDAQGDFARTSDGMANASRIIEASLKDLQVEIGEQLLPIVAPLISDFASNLPEAMDTARGYIENIQPAIETAADLFGDLRDRGEEAAGRVDDVRVSAEDVVGPLWDAVRGGAGTAASLGLVEGAATGAGVALGVLATVHMANAIVQAASLTTTAARAAAALAAMAMVAAPGLLPVLGAAAPGIAITVAEIDRRMKDLVSGIGSGIETAINQIDLGLQQIGENFDRHAGKVRETGDKVERGIADGVTNELDAISREYAATAKAASDAGAASTSSNNKTRSSAGGAASGVKEIERAYEDTEDAVKKMSDVVGKLDIDIMNMTQEFGDRWIEQWFEVDAAIKATQRDAHQALQDLENRETLDTSISARRKKLDERLADEDLAHRYAVEDSEARYQLERDLARAKSDDDRARIREQFGYYQEDVAHRRQVEAEEAEWRKYLEQERATLERELHEEELARQRAAIIEERDKRIEAINQEWAEWQKIEAQKLEEAKKNAKAEAQNKLIAIRDDYLAKLPEAAQPAIDDMKARLEAAFGVSFAQIASSGVDTEGNWALSGGVSGTDPNHAPGGADYEAWVAGGRYDPTNSGGDIPFMAAGGNIIREGWAVVGDRGPELLHLPRGAQVAPLSGSNAFDYDRLAKTIGQHQKPSLNVQTTIVSPEPLSPSRIRRQQETMLRSLALEYGI